MKKKELKRLAKKYGANEEALKICLLKEGYDLKSVSYIEVLKTMYGYGSELFYTRMESDGTYEFLDIGIIALEDDIDRLEI